MAESGAGEGGGLTIDELARRVGMTVRNVRAHQSRGMLPPPEIRGRTGYYDDRHVARLELIKELQAEGFNLGAIARILERSPAAASGDVLDFTRAATQPFGDDQPVVLDGSDLVERWGGELPPKAIERARKLGLVRPLGGDRFELASARLERAAGELADLGVPFDRTLEVAALLRRHSEAVAREYVRLFVDFVWAPFREAGEPEGQLAEVRAALERLRPLASESLLAVFAIAMSEAVEAALQRELARLGGGGVEAPRTAPGHHRSRSRRSRSRPRSR